MEESFGEWWWCPECGESIEVCASYGTCPNSQISKSHVATQHVNAADGAKAEPVCSFFGCADLVCEADKDLPQRMHFCQNHHDQLQGYIERGEVPKIIGFWVKANGGAKRLADTF